MFRTKVIPKISSHKIDLKDYILAIGSCFVQNIGQKFADFKFDIDINPFGTLFNPLSIFKLVNRAALNKGFESSRIVESQGVFHHYDLHSDLSKLNKEELLAYQSQLKTVVVVLSPAVFREESHRHHKNTSDHRYWTWVSL